MAARAAPLTAPPADSSERVRERRFFLFDPGIVLKTGATLVRQWGGHAHTVLVREDGFEYEGQRYRSLTVIAERITGAHWSGPAVSFGVSKRARATLVAEAPNEKNHQPRRGETEPSAVRSTPANRPRRGLEQEFNSLQAQREACEAFINSQRHEGWVCPARRLMMDGRVLRRDDGSACSAAAARRPHGRGGSIPWSSTKSTG